jgi:hypothetical protein
MRSRRLVVTVDQRDWTERRTRAIAAEAGLPEPDEVEHRDSSIVLLWHELKLAVEVDEIPGGPPPPFDPCDLSQPDDGAADTCPPF